MRLFSLTFSLLLLAQGALACPFTITTSLRPSGNSYEVRWDEVPGTILYKVYERRDDEEGFRLTKELLADGEPPRFVATASSTRNAYYNYLVIAEGPNGIACVATKQLEIKGDQKLAEATHKRIVLLAGSARGANGSDFRTSLTLHFRPFAEGKVVFRPTGTMPSAADPSLPYKFGDNSSPNDLHWDDVLAAMGATGTGSLEIIPKPNPQDDFLAIPEITAHVYNVTPNGTFGSRIPEVAPSEWLRTEETQTRSLTIPPAQGNYRRNGGFRTLTEVQYIVSVIEPGQNPRRSEIKKVPANVTVFGSLDDLFGGPVSSTARVFIRIHTGHAIAFYTYTENSTNDPTLVFRDPRETGGVTWGY